LSKEIDPMTERKRVLILCTGNSARSQMAEGLLRHDGGARFEVESAGVSPTAVRPEAVAAMRELGIDISDQRSKSVDEFADQNFDYVITVCDNAREQCPVFPAAPRPLEFRRSGRGRGRRATAPLGLPPRPRRDTRAPRRVHLGRDGRALKIHALRLPP
jgi:arsenate reductase